VWVAAGFGLALPQDNGESLLSFSFAMLYATKRGRSLTRIVVCQTWLIPLGIGLVGTEPNDGVLRYLDREPY
jgi:hypothetical protein